MLHKKTIFLILISLLFLILVIYLLSLIFSSGTNSSHVIILPLQSSTNINDLSSLFNNNLRTTIKASDKNTEVDLFLLSQDFSFFITQKDIFFDNYDKSEINIYSNNFYDYKLSSSIKILSNRTQTTFTKYKYGRQAEEDFALCNNNCDKNTINLKQFTFMLVEDPYDGVSGGIGLAPNEFIADGAFNLFNELYREKYIKSPVWYIDYHNEGEKKLIIGKLPYEYSNDYSEDEFEFVNAGTKGALWELEMTKIKIGYEENDENNDNIINDRLFVFRHEYSLIYGPPDYYKKIKNIYFNKYLSNQCSENTITYQSTKYLYISCNEDISLEDFPPLVIDISNSLKFELTYEDMFMKDNGKILFLFVTDKKERYFNGKWHIGEPFLKKYMPIYNQKERKMGFYELIKKQKKSYKAAGIVGFIFLIASIGVAIYLSLFLFKRYRKRKIRRAAMEMKIEEISSKLILNKNEKN